MKHLLAKAVLHEPPVLVGQHQPPVGRIVAKDIVDSKTGELLASANDLFVGQGHCIYLWIYFGSV